VFDPLVFKTDLAAARERAKARQEARARLERSADKAYWNLTRKNCGRDPFISYGIPPKLNQHFQRTGKGTMFEPPSRLDPEKVILMGEYAPTAERLHRHAERFGPEGVQEIADVYGVNMRVKKAIKKAPRQRRTTDDLRRQVIDLRERGLVQGAIADALNVSDERVRAILVSAEAA
jgi:hypothetical protein